MKTCLCFFLAVFFALETRGAGQKGMKYFSYSGVVDNGSLTVLVDESNAVRASYSPSPYAKKKAWSNTGSLAPEQTQKLFGMAQQVKLEGTPASDGVLRPGEATHSFIVGVGSATESQFSFKLDKLTQKQKALVEEISAVVRRLQR